MDRHGIEIQPRSDRRLLRTDYEFDLNGGDGHQRALHRAFEQHAELVPALSELYRETVEAVFDDEGAASKRWGLFPAWRSPVHRGVNLSASAYRGADKRHRVPIDIYSELART